MHKWNKFQVHVHTKHCLGTTVYMKSSEKTWTKKLSFFFFILLPALSHAHTNIFFSILRLELNKNREGLYLFLHPVAQAWYGDCDSYNNSYEYLASMMSVTVSVRQLAIHGNSKRRNLWFHFILVFPSLWICFSWLLPKKIPEAHVKENSRQYRKYKD